MHRRDRRAGPRNRPLAPALSVAAAAGAVLLRVAAHLLDRRTAQGDQALYVRRALEAERAARGEKARNSFLRGISHDLRTPLAAIIGASGMLAEDGEHLGGAMRTQLAEGIATDAQWLLSMVDNILSLTRIQGGELTLAKTEEAAEELAAQAVARFRRRHPGVAVSVVHSGPLLLVPVDALLIAQVLGNLLDNAARHGDIQGHSPVITVTLAREGGFALFTVADNGPGLSPGALSGLFRPAEPPSAGPEETPRGHGMGLAICHAIVEAHGGWMRAESPAEGGARLTFGLPMAGCCTGGGHGK